MRVTDSITPQHSCQIRLTNPPLSLSLARLTQRAPTSHSFSAAAKKSIADPAVAVPCLGFRIECSGFGVEGLGFGVWDLVFSDWGLRFRDWGSSFGFEGFGLRFEV